MPTKLLVGGLFLATALSGGAWVNLDFEQVTPAPYGEGLEVVGWDHQSAIGTPLDDGANLSEWAEAVLMRPDFGWGPMEAHHSIAFYSAYARWVTSADQSPLWVDMGYTGNEQIGRASIGQAGTLGGDETLLTFVTDYTGPSEPQGGSDPLRWGVGEMVISFDGNPVAFTLEDEEISGQWSKRVWADLTSFVGQTGELRIGIEGPHNFRIDTLQLVPEGRSWISVSGLGVVGGLALVRRGLRGS